MKSIAASELIINERGAIYHLNVHPQELAHTIITVGDPERVKEVSKYFDSIEHRCTHREFVTHTGYIGKKRISCVGTGIGPDNVDIVFNELDALVNIDFATRTVKEKHTPLQIIRMGTCGALQADIPVDSLVASTHGLGVDNLLHFYRMENNEEEKQLIQSFVTHTQLHGHHIYPYINAGSVSLLKHFVNGYVHGITVTAPGFYGPQGRVLRLGLSNPDWVDRLTAFCFGAHRITNFEMETSAMYGLAKLLGHHSLSLNAVVANRVQKAFSKDGKAAVENLIKKSLEIIEKL